MSKEKVWERQPEESVQAYEAFKIYRDLGLKRSNQEVCQQLSKSRQLISRWKAIYHWDDRVMAYDKALEQEAHRQAVKNLKDMTNRHIEISLRLQDKALEALNVLNIKDISPKDIREFIKMATELERQNRAFEMENRAKNQGSTSLVDTIIAAYQKRKEEDNA